MRRRRASHLLLFDGASLEYIWTRAAEGRLPNFARLIESGAAIDLATIRPTQPDPVWAAVATGMYPSKNGARSAAAYYAWGDNRPVDLLPDHCFAHLLVSLGIIRDVPKTSTAWRSRPLWTILADAGVSVGIVRWPLTYPAQPVLGFLVADRFHDAAGSMFEFDDGGSYPSSSGPARATVVGRRRVDIVVRLRSVQESPEESAFLRDRFYSRVMQILRDEWHPAGDRPALPGARSRRPPALERRSSRARAPTRPRKSGDGPLRRWNAPTWPWTPKSAPPCSRSPPTICCSSSAASACSVCIRPKRVLAQIIGDSGITGTHERAPDGFLLAYGTAVEPGRRQRGSMVDVTPTVLYYLGLPVGRDMDGYARSDLFRRRLHIRAPHCVHSHAQPVITPNFRTPNSQSGWFEADR